MILESIVYLLKNITGVCLVLFMLNKLIGYRMCLRKIPLGVCAAVTFAMTVLPFWLTQDASLAGDIADFSTLFAFVAFPYCVLQSQKKLSFFWFGFILNSVFDLFVSVLSIAFHIKSALVMDGIYIAMMLVCLGVFFYMAKKHYIVSSNFFEKIPTIVFVAVFASCISTYYTMMIPVQSAYSQRVSRVLVIAAAIVVVVCILFIVMRYLSIVLKQRESLAQLDLQVKHYEALSEKNQSIRRFRHDINNNMLVLNSLVSDGKLEEAKQYLEELNFALSASENKYSTGNPLADAILNQKQSEAQQQGIEIAFSGFIPGDKIKKNDICTILANLLDNAIRGCCAVAPCRIDVEADSKPTGLKLTVSNPVLQDVPIKNNTIKTTKTDKENHGIGMENIRRAAEQYNGTVTFTCENRIFTAKVILLYPD